jgi:branched-chain amino acid transport system permease protein
MRTLDSGKAIAVHVGVAAALFGLQFVLSDYDKLTLTRIMVIAIYAIGYNVLFGYTGLLSLGHALFFATGLYAAGLPVYYFGWSIPLAFLFAIAASLLVSFLIGIVALRTTGVSFMIVTLMFAQAAYLLVFFFTDYTQGDAGLTLPSADRSFSIVGHVVDLTKADVRYNLAFILLALAILIVFLLVRSPGGRVLVAIRENEERTQMLGYDSFANKLKAFMVAGGLSGASGATFALLFAYVGASFASIQYSIEVLLFTLLGGAGTILGPLLGTTFMIYLIDKISEFTTAYLLIVGAALIVLILWFPKGILGTVRERWLAWLP